MLIRGLAYSILLCLPALAVAHHAIGGNYDPNSIIEVEGEVTDVLWRNPHAQVSIRVSDAAGNAQDWDMATTSLSNIRRWENERTLVVVTTKLARRSPA